MRNIYIVYVNSQVHGCFSSVDKAKKFIKISHFFEDKWEIVEKLLNDIITDSHDVVCNYRTNDDKYYYNPSFHYVLCPIYIIHDKEKCVIAGCYSSFNIAKERTKHLNNIDIIHHNLDEPLQSILFKIY